MKRLLIAVATVALVFAWATPAQANHDNADYYIEESSVWLADVWLDNVQRGYCTDGFWLGNGENGGDLSQTEINNSEASIIHQVTEWEVETDITTNWVFNGGCTTSMFWEGMFDGNYANTCENINAEHPGIGSRVDYDEFYDDTVFGDTLTCDMDHNGIIDFFWIVINEDKPWHYYWNTNPATGEFDFTGLFTHEFGHATGFNGHFPGSSGACDTNPLSAFSDMCTGNTIGFFNGASSDGKAWRSLTAHDIGEANQAY